MPIIVKGDLVSVTDPRRRLTRSIPKSVFDAHKAFAERMLNENSGYLHARERVECKAVVAEEGFFELVNPEKTERRIGRIKQAGVPPIFQEELEGRTKAGPFPTVDFLLQFVSGNFRKRQIAQHIHARYAGRKVSTGIIPATVEDILAFRMMAFDGDRLSPLIYREINEYVKTKFRLSEDQVETIPRSDVLVLKYLEVALGGVKPRERSFETYSEGAPLTFAEETMWHTSYKPEDRERIINDYLTRLRNKVADIVRNKKLLGIMKVLFPDAFPEEVDLERLDLERRMTEHRAQGVYNNMPQIVLADPRFGTKYIDELKAHIAARCQEALDSEESLSLFDNVNEIAERFRIPVTLFYLPEFRDVLTSIRLQLLRDTDDDTFATRFRPQQIVSLGHRQAGEYSLVDKQFRTEILQRAERLKITINEWA